MACCSRFKPSGMLTPRRLVNFWPTFQRIVVLPLLGSSSPKRLTYLKIDTKQGYVRPYSSRGRIFVTLYKTFAFQSSDLLLYPPALHTVKVFNVIWIRATEQASGLSSLYFTENSTKITVKLLFENKYLSIVCSLAFICTDGYADSVFSIKLKSTSPPPHLFEGF